MFNFEYQYDPIGSHSIHSYPAKFPPAIPKQIFEIFIKDKEALVFDPFSGSGTTLLEGLLHSCHVIGNDTNPIGNLIAETKLTIFSEQDFSLASQNVGKIRKIFNNKENVDLGIQFHNKDHWFQRNVQKEMTIILKTIHDENNTKVKNILKTTLSEIAINVSNQESDTRYAAIDKNILDSKTIDLFERKLTLNIKKLRESSKQINPKLNKQIFSLDSRNLSKIKNESIDVIVTSPPYANTYDYYLYHKHRMHWLGYDCNRSKETEIGSRHQFSSKKDPISLWEGDIRSFLIEFKRVTKKGGKICLVLGDSVVNKKLFNANDCVINICKEIHLEHIHTESVPLAKNTRQFNHKWRSKLNKLEHVIFLEV